MATRKERLENLKSEGVIKQSQWIDDAISRKESKGWIRTSQKIAFKILQTLKAKKLKQKDLAELLDIKPQQVNKWVKGKENFTLETISRIENALSISLLVLPENRKASYERLKKAVNTFSDSADMKNKNEYPFYKPTTNRSMRVISTETEKGQKTVHVGLLNKDFTDYTPVKNG